MDLRVTTGRRSRRAGHDRGYTPTPHPLGFELAGAGEGWHAPVFLGVFVAAFGVAAVATLVIAVNGAGPPAWYFVAAFGAVELLLIWMLARLLRVRASWEASRLVVDTWPLLIGGAATAWFARPLEDGMVTPRPAGANLILRESATYRVGTDTRTATDDVLTIPLSLAERTVEDVTGFETTISIPDTGPPTIQLDSNLVEWLVVVDLASEGAPTTTSTFTVLVAPRRVPA